MPDKIHLTVATVVERNGKFLMVRETKNGSQVINQPAGHVEPGEDVMAAAIRETLEETGWLVELNGFLGFSNARSSITGITYYRLVFTAKPIAFDDQAELDSDIDYAEWMSVPAIKSSSNKPRSEMVHLAVDDYLSGRIFPLEMFRNSL
ncbi:MAG: NUDIX hydrolase [Porticoccaceae bacterium]|nr:NUDIX hydrolase [Porticoccaceae bacterium]MDG1473594.1 NUDIX hydrolase [Porticoccaceae bacterium]